MLKRLGTFLILVLLALIVAAVYEFMVVREGFTNMKDPFMNIVGRVFPGQSAELPSFVNPDVQT